MNPRWFLRLARLVRNPPSKERQRLYALVLAAAAVIGGIEFFFGWPEWLTVNDWRGGMRGFTPLPEE